MKVRTRYAPSPTGYLHIGGARTALFNYLFAKAHNGDFIIRIEDTDIERNVEGGIDSQLDYLAWMGIEADESIKNPKEYGPYIQSAKLAKYQQLAEQLIKENKAYRCFCTKEQLEQDRLFAEQTKQTPKYNKRCLYLSQQEIDQKLEANTEFTIRLIINENEEFSWNDLIRGQISIPASALTDPVILKSNKIAMYNFAVVVDDYDMAISHVIRGEEHISNTPYQLAITKALGYEPTIQYAHLSIIVDETGKKLSKRNLALKQFVADYSDDGYWPHAVVNFISLLGWSPKDNKEKMSMDELIASFDLNHVSKAPAYFDIEKMNWFSNQYFNQISVDQFSEFLKEHQLTDSYVENDPEFINKALLFKPQIYNLKQLLQLIDEHFISQQNLSETDLDFIKTNQLENVVITFNQLLSNIDQWDEVNIKALIKETQQQTNTKGMNLFMPIRIATTFMSHGPELAKMIYFSTKEKVLANLATTLKLLK
ncbi:glutamyl-tRNA synthetase [Ureaplasma diversum]|uniref:Glutamate--tRNA ligase n=1 Tax=Ureaplasma diversum TaxID=42094 RepID=A0A0C5RQE6_9BACT|nr:glutamate--tRNA ligase [Ureaplasma diversum]AJQ45639.1 glutamyl-tRNA synthetase [Ureaplasma diversum]